MAKLEHWHKAISNWSEIRTRPKCWRGDGVVGHESLLRSYQILNAVEGMLGRGDSHETILLFIREMETAPDTAPHELSPPDGCFSAEED